LVSSLFNKVFKTHFVKKNYLAFANMQRVSKSADYLKMTDLLKSKIPKLSSNDLSD